MLRILGIGALVAGGLAVALAALVAVILLGPLIFWVAWNVLDFASAVGLPELAFWGIVLATLFLVVGWFGKVGSRRSSSSSIPPGSTALLKSTGRSPRSATSSPSPCSPCSRRDRTRRRTSAPAGAKAELSPLAKASAPLALG